MSAYCVHTDSLSSIDVPICATELGKNDQPLIPPNGIHTEINTVHVHDVTIAVVCAWENSFCLRIEKRGTKGGFTPTPCVRVNVACHELKQYCTPTCISHKA